jgi:dTDP-4-amino-4,6-dideoxygalactose transaminase
MGGSEESYIAEAFRDNWIAPLGPNVVGLEKSLESFLGGNKFVAALSSGTSALHLALVMLGIGAGDEVLCQSFTFAASVNPVLYVGATPVFIDSEPESWNICPDFLEQAIKDRINKGKKPGAIIAVHLYGMPYKHKEISEIALRYDIPVIEDAAEALGSSYNGLPCGTLSAFSVLSFNGNKIITTSGGGALVCNTNEMKAKAVFLATQAKDTAPHYEHSTLGYNYRMSNISAGIGRGQMEVLKERVVTKRQIFDKYSAFFKSVNGVSMQEECQAGVVSNRWLTTILMDDNIAVGRTSRELMEAMENENIESRLLWKPMHLQPLYKDNLYYGNDIAQNLFLKGLCLPSGTNMADAEWERIFNCLYRFFR